MNDKSKQIAEQNDLFRQNFGSPINEDCLIQGKYFVTSGISSLSIPEQLAITLKTRNFNDFNTRNDPHGERDLGKFNVNGHDALWKIDYYDTNYQYGSEAPTMHLKHVVF